MGTLTLVRHGETAWSAAGRHTGRTDVPLTPRGEGQAAALGRVLCPDEFALVLTSPLRRARRTAELADLARAESDERLAEWDYGGYEGRTTAEISSALGRPWSVFADGVVPGATPGETLDDVAARAGDVLLRVAPVLEAGGDVALVGHGHQLRVLAACWLELAPDCGAKLRLAAGSISRLGHEHGVPAVELWNAIPPLR